MQNPIRSATVSWQVPAYSPPANCLVQLQTPQVTELLPPPWGGSSGHLAIRTLFPHMLLPKFSILPLIPDRDPLRCFLQPSSHPYPCSQQSRRKTDGNSVTAEVSQTCDSSCHSRGERLDPNSHRSQHLHQQQKQPQGLEQQG